MGIAAILGAAIPALFFENQIMAVFAAGVAWGVGVQMIADKLSRIIGGWR